MAVDNGQPGLNHARFIVPAMAFDPGQIATTLAAAVGDDPGLIVDLRLAFVDSTRHAFAALERAPDVAAWQKAAHRIEGIAASFGATRLMALARSAAAGPPFDRDVVRRLDALIERL